MRLIAKIHRDPEGLVCSVKPGLDAPFDC
jgi:hypothetical protein